jgi:hypothetical protein
MLLRDAATTLSMSPTDKTGTSKVLEGLKRALKNFFFNTRRRNFRISDTAADMRGMDDSDVWFVDPVHPVNGVYTRIAEGIKRIASNYEGRIESGGGGGSSNNGGGFQPGIGERPARWL